MKINQPYLLLTLMIWLAGASVMAGTVDLRFNNISTNCNTNQVCVNVQMRAQSGTVKVGNGTVYITYNTQAINNPTATALNFTTPQYGYAPQFSSYENGSVGEGNYNILLGSAGGNPTTTVSTDWIDVAQFCFTLVNVNQSPNLQFSSTYTGFNSETNQPSAQHTLGTLSGENNALACVTNQTLQLKVFLEGPFSAGTGSMSKTLNTSNLIPLAQPYNITPFNYAGTESLASLPTDMVDWVLVQLSSDPAVTGNSDIVRSKAAVLLSNGSVVDPGGTSLSFSGLSGSSYYVIVRHRNHMAVVTPTAVSLSSGSTVDLTTSTLTYNGIAQCKQVGASNYYVMKAGNADGNMNINTFDFVQWKNQNAQLGQYLKGDFDMNANVNTFDFVKWKANNGQLGVSTIAP